MRQNGPERILIVDDEPGVLKMAVRMLESAGYRVMAAATSGEALALLDETSDTVDLMITDLVMPQMTGQDLAAEVRKRHPSLNVMFTSGADGATRAGARRLDAPFLAKPYSKADLLRCVRQVLDGQFA